MARLYQCFGWCRRRRARHPHPRPGIAWQRPAENQAHVATQGELNVKVCHRTFPETRDRSDQAIKRRKDPSAASTTRLAAVVACCGQFVAFTLEVLNMFKKLVLVGVAVGALCGGSAFAACTTTV
ncbi:MAG: hypothetical protein ACREWJ_02570, partial [Rhodoferax sp.]